MENVPQVHGKFYTSTNLQGSQTESSCGALADGFYTSTNLQGSQTYRKKVWSMIGFTLLQIYKVLKPPNVAKLLSPSFTLLQIYKVLKLLLR